MGELLAALAGGLIGFGFGALRHLDHTDRRYRALVDETAEIRAELELYKAAQRIRGCVHAPAEAEADSAGGEVEGA